MSTIRGSATNSALTAVKNKKPDVSSLEKKTDYDTETSDIEKKLLIMIMTNILLFQNIIL